MDLYCQLCGEPYDYDHVMHELTLFESQSFRDGLGCPACNWGARAPKQTPLRAQLASAMADVLDDDVDGLAAEMNDAEYLLGESFWE